MLLALLFNALLLTAQAQTVNLQLQNDYTNPGTLYSPSFAIGDVNNDGRPDLVATNRATTGDFIGVYLNNGTGSFGTAFELTLPAAFRRKLARRLGRKYGRQGGYCH
ncbi:hypothetical protein BH18ACI1_BH18ACI1_16810 [soil metagenome]